MHPQYKVETYTGAVLDYTFTTEIPTLYCKNVISEGVGHFNFTLPIMKGVTSEGYLYTDIALHDKVKIYFWDADTATCPATPDFAGRITKILGPLNVTGGYTWQISGLSLGEILLRRFKTNKFYDGIHADVIAGDVATDLSLGTDFSGDAADDYHVTLEVRTKTYWDIIKFVSDYWVTAGTQVKKDFYVDVGDGGHLDGHLVWKTRPIRTVGVETLTVGTNIISYNVTRDIDNVRNSITVYGSADKPVPTDKDYCETLDNWTASVGTVGRVNADPAVGSWNIEGTPAGGTKQCTFKRTFDRITIRDINKLYFWRCLLSITPDTCFVRLHAPNNTNYFYADIEPGGTLTWVFKDLTLGPNQEYDAEDNPNGIWYKQGSPNWWDIEAIEFDNVDLNNDVKFDVDGIYFYPTRWSDTTSDAGSITSYGQRDLEVTDEKLHSDAACEARSETLLYQLKDPPTEIQVIVPLNTNILVGDRLSMTIPAEGIAGVNYDVVGVAHSMDSRGFKTEATMVNSGNIREPISVDPVVEIGKLKKSLAQVFSGIEGTRVR